MLIEVTDYRLNLVGVWNEPKTALGRFFQDRSWPDNWQWQITDVRRVWINPDHIVQIKPRRNYPGRAEGEIFLSTVVLRDGSEVHMRGVAADVAREIEKQVQLNSLPRPMREGHL